MSSIEIQKGRFYVYRHRRESDGKVFYIGKGTGWRAWSCSYPSRSRYWVRVYKKHGRIVEIIRNGLNENCALTLESIEIAASLSRGDDLVNHNATGLPSSAMGARVIYSSAGDKYMSVEDATNHMVLIGYIKAGNGNIAAAARGERNYAYGRAWSYAGIPPHPKSMKYEMPPIETSMGEVFNKIKDAVGYLKNNGYEKASHSAISSCLSGRQKIAYDRSWSYTNRYASRPSANFSEGPHI